MSYIGDFNPSAVIYGRFTTVGITGAPTTLAGTPALSVYKTNSTTQTTTGVSLSVDHDSVTGLHLFTVDTSADGTFYAAGCDFQVVITTGTVGGTSVVGYVVSEFSIENRNIKANVTQFGGSNGTFSSGRPEVNTTHIEGTDATDQIRDAAAAALVVHRLDELLNADSDIDGAAPPTVGSVFHELMSKSTGSFTYNQTTDSLEAIRDTGDASWATPIVPTAADIADAVWDEGYGGHQTNGTFGKIVTQIWSSIYAGGGTVDSTGATASSFRTDIVADDDFYNDMLLTFTSGDLSGQTRPIADFTSTNGVFTFDEAFAAAPANGVTFSVIRTHVHPVSQIATEVWSNGTRTLTAIDEDSTTLDLDGTIRGAVGLSDNNLGTLLDYIQDTIALRIGTAQAGASSTVTLDSGASSTDSYYVGTLVALLSGTGAGQCRPVTAYVGSTRVATVSPAWTTTPDNTTEFAILPRAQLDGGLDAAAVRSAVGLASANLDTQLSTIDTVVDAILVDTGTDGVQVAANAISDDQLHTNAVNEIRNAITGGAYALDTDASGRVRIVSGTAPGEVSISSGLLAWNPAWDAEVQSEVQDAIEANHLDHLLAATYDPASKPGAADALLNELVESDSGVSRFTANALEQAPTGGSAPTASAIADEVQTRTIAGVTLVGTTTNLTNLPTIPNNWLTAAGLASDAVTEIQSGLATSSAVSTLQTSVDDIPTNAELATALDPLPTAAEIRAEIDSNSTQLAAIVADTNELQSDWVNGGRLDLILDARASQTSVNTAQADLDILTGSDGATLATSQPNYAPATAAALTTVGNNVSAILADTGTDGVVLSTATLQSIADTLLARNVSNVEGSAPEHSLTAIVLGMLESSRSGTTWTIKRTDGSTTFATKTLTVDAAADPITGVT